MNFSRIFLFPKFKKLVSQLRVKVDLRVRLSQLATSVFRGVLLQKTNPCKV